MIDFRKEEGDGRKMTLAELGRDRARAARQILKMRKIYLGQRRRFLECIKNGSKEK